MTRPGSARKPSAVRRIGRWLVHLVVVLLVLGTFAVPVAAVVTTGGLGLPSPPPEASLAALVRGKVAPLREMPIATPGGAVAQEIREGRILSDPGLMHEAVDAAAQRVLGRGTSRFWQILVGGDNVDFFADADAGSSYPYRYPALDRLVDVVLPTPVPSALIPGLNDLAALLILAAADFPKVGAGGAFLNRLPGAYYAAGAAFDLLERVREAQRSCSVQLNLAFLLSTDNEPQDDLVATEFDRAHDACPGDPTPLWLLGQFQMQRAYLVRPVIFVGQILNRDQLAPRPFATFRRLEQELPASPAGWSGEADAEVKLAEEAADGRLQPFTARHRFEHALTLYQRAAQLSDDAGFEIGMARALAGLGRYDEAAATARRAYDMNPNAAAFQTQLIEELERAGRYADAADLATNARFPDPATRRNLISRAAAFGTSPTISLGIERTSAVTLTVAPPPGRGGFASVYDFSFIPVYRSDDPAFTGFEPWCRQRSRLRDLILAGRFGDVLEAASAGAKMEEFTPGYTCDGAGAVPVDDTPADSGLRQQSDNALYRFAAVAAAQTGDASAASDWLRRIKPLYTSDNADRTNTTFTVDGDLVNATAYLYDTRQNLWRFGGDLTRAAEVTREWTRATPRDPLAWDRAGEVAFNQGRYADAAQAFARSASAASDPGNIGSIARATAELKQGAALGLAGQDENAVASLRRAQSAGAAVEAAIGDDHWADEGAADPGAYHGAVIAYYAAIQLGDAGLRQRAYSAAAAGYHQAVDASRAFDVVNDEVKEHEPSPLLSGAAENNLALAQLKLGRLNDAVASATSAVGRDPQSPVYLQTLAYAEVLSGRQDAAAAAYRQALGYDPTLFPSANDLGVLLAEQGKDDEALKQLRRAVGVKPDYALGWFNLGVVLSGMGPSHFLQAQGALGRAAQLDSSYRGASRELGFDAEPYFSGLDISRPLPPQWRFAEHERRAPATLTLLVLAVLLLRLLWSLVLDQAAGKAGERVLGWASGEPTRHRPWQRVLGVRIVPIVAVVATVGLLLWPLLASQQPQPAEGIVLGTGVLALTWAYMRTRVATAAQAGVTVRHFTWIPAIGFGAVLAAVGLAFAPVPAADTTVRRGLLRWGPPALLAALAVGLLVLGWIFDVPTTRALGASALVMVSSVMLPVRPYDGAFIKGRLVNMVMVVGLLGISTLLFLGLI